MAKIRISSGKTACVDDADVNWVLQWRWQHDHGYVSRRVRKDGIAKKIYLHRALLDAPAGVEVDHINGNGLDNRRTNLRLATKSQNAANATKRSGTTSRFKGVYLHRVASVVAGRMYSYTYWCARIHTCTGVQVIGYFKNEEEAAKAYDTEARSIYGRYARLNFT